jgi:hypothetical protein
MTGFLCEYIVFWKINGADTPIIFQAASGSTHVSIFPLRFCCQSSSKDGQLWMLSGRCFGTKILLLVVCCQHAPLFTIHATYLWGTINWNIYRSNLHTVFTWSTGQWRILNWIVEDNWNQGKKIRIKFSNFASLVVKTGIKVSNFAILAMKTRIKFSNFANL